MSSEERRKILQMVQDGRISAEQASSLMRALDADPDPPDAPVAVGFVAHHGTLDPGLPTALCGGGTEEDNRANHLVVMLEGINKVQPNLLKLLLSGHEMAPFQLKSAPRSTLYLIVSASLFA